MYLEFIKRQPSLLKELIMFVCARKFSILTSDEIHLETSHPHKDSNHCQLPTNKVLSSSRSCPCFPAQVHMTSGLLKSPSLTSVLRISRL